VGVRMKNVVIFNLSLYNIIFYFAIYAFLGWCVEVAYAALNSGKFVNRGFLNGPVCPIYGFGVVFIIAFLTPIENNFFVLFIGAVFITSFIEYMTGFVLEKVFHHRWWDYSDEPFNIRGYICLKFSLIWGIASIFIIKVVHTVIYDVVRLIPNLVGIIFIAIIIISFLIDFISAVQTVLKLNVRLRKIDEISVEMRNKSDILAKEISKNTIELKKLYDENSVEFKQKHEASIIEIKNKYEKESAELKVKYDKLTARRHIFQRRVLKAFPNIKSNRYFGALEELKKKI